VRDVAERVRRIDLSAFARWETLLVGLLVVLAVVGTGISDQFLTGDSFTTGSLDFSEYALMAVALALVIVAGEIDLSIASTLALSSAVMGWLWNQGQPIETIIPLCLVVGALCGAFNGLLVTRLGLPSLAVTIGTLALFRGLAFVVIGDGSVTDFPVTWTDRAFGNAWGTAIPNTIVLFAVLALVLAVLLHATPFGRSVYAIGANEEAARFSGLRVKRIKFWLFVVSGVVAALAGIVFTFRFASARADNGAGLELSVVACVLLGGVSIWGGRGTMLGVVAAVFLLGTIRNALTINDVSADVLTIVTGSLLLFSVLGPSVAARGREALRRRGHPSTPSTTSSITTPGGEA
jgi:rhamnose transport system permease protein